eukprot:3328066-Amphidinium_carterae.1
MQKRRHNFAQTVGADALGAVSNFVGRCHAMPGMVWIGLSFALFLPYEYNLREFDQSGTSGQSPENSR